MELLNKALTEALALPTLDYSEEGGEIVLAVDASGEGWGAILQQEKDGKRHPIRYESGVWTAPEKKYNAGKREYRALLKSLKKLKVCIYGVRFMVEIDAKTLLHQLNLPIVDLPGAMVTRWITWIRLFDFDVRHVPGRQHSEPDSLSRRPNDDDGDDDDDYDSMEEGIDYDLGVNHVVIARASTPERFSLNRGKKCLGQDSVGEGHFASARASTPERINLATELEIADLAQYDEHYHKIIRFLQTMQVPTDIPVSKDCHFRIEATKYHIVDGVLFRRNTKGRMSRKVICHENDKKAILKALHEESGHRGRDGTATKILKRYWWRNVYRDTKEHVQSCDECQRRLNVRVEEVLHPNLTSTMWNRVCVDVVHMPKGVGGSKYLVVAREDVSGWPEARAIRKANSQTVVSRVSVDTPSLNSHHGLADYY